MKRRSALAAAGAGAVAALVASSRARPAEPPLLAGLPALRRGVNLTHWFEYEQGQDVPAVELQLLAAAGVDHVRVPVDPLVLGWQPGAAAGALPWLPAVRVALEAVLGAGLDAVFDLHLAPAGKQQFEDQPALEPALVALWSDIATGLADLPSARLAFELYNEPQYYGRSAAGRWADLQARLLAAVRAPAPGHLVLLTGNEGGSLQGLRNLPPVADAAVAHVFHYYEPFLFTHQGAYWLDPRWTTAGLRSDVYYPAAAQGAVVPGLAAPHPNAAAELADYLGDATHAPQGSGDRVRADIAAAASLAATLGIRLVCNEFGAIRAGVDPPSRWRLLADVRSALEAAGIGWTVWDYCDIFGICAESALPPGQHATPRGIEPGALQALGLGRKARAQRR